MGRRMIRVMAVAIVCVLVFFVAASLYAALEAQLLVGASPSSDNVPYQKTQWYGFTATAGQGYRINLTPSAGNPDLYLFDTGFNRVGYSKSTGLTQDKAWFGQATSGPMHIAAFGVYNPSSNYTVQVITSPYVKTISPTSGTVGTLVTLTGFGFGDTRGTNYVKFGAVTATSYSSWTNTQIKVYVPSGIATGTIQAVVYVASRASNPLNFTTIVTSDGSMDRYNLARTGSYPNGPTSLPLNLKWKADVSWHSNDASPVMANNILYVPIDRYVYAFDPDTGVKKWTAGFFDGYVTFGPAVGTNGIVYLADTQGFVYALGATDGILKWKTALTPSRGGGWAPAVFNNLVYCAALNKVFALDANTGAVKWSYTFFGIPEEETAQSSPSIANGVLYICSSRKVYALDAYTGALKWTYVYPAEWGFLDSRFIVISNGMAYFGSGGYQKILAVDANTGILKWVFNVGTTVTTACALDKGVLYFGSWDYFGSLENSNKIYALDAATGVLKWSYSIPVTQQGSVIVSSPSVSNGIVYFGTKESNGVVYGLDGSNGLLKWRSAVLGYIKASPGIWNGKVYISVTGNGVYCFGQ